MLSMLKNNVVILRAHDNKALDYTWSFVPAFTVPEFGTEKEYIGHRGRLRC